MTKRALVTGVTGQDGAYLSQLLLDKGYEVHGVVRRSSHRGVEDHRLRWLGVSGKVTSARRRSCRSFEPAAHRPGRPAGRNLQSRGAILRRVLLAPADPDGERHRRRRDQRARGHALGAPNARFYQASSSEMYGLIQEPMQSEKTPFYPR